MSRPLPSGRVTFAFTDVVGSTKAFIAHGPAYVEAVQRLQGIVATHAERHGGVVVSTEGDGAMLAFPSAQSAVNALTQLQRLVEGQGDHALKLRIRAGAHTGDAEPIGDVYVALPVYIAARVAGAAGAGQLVVSQATVDHLECPIGERLGEFALKDVSEPVTLWRLAGDETPLSVPPARRTNVAEPRTSFVGRESDLKQIHSLLASTTPVTVVGTGGMGKTRLVSEFALLNAESYAAGAWLVELAQLDSAEQILPEIAEVLGLSGPTTHESVRAELRGKGETLLILDNCEHLLESVADLVTSLAADCPALRILCTSREPLEVPAETVLRLRPLPVGDRDVDGGVAEQLFASRAVGAGVVLDSIDRAALTDVCRLLDGVPIALELAAARAPAMPLPDLAEALRAGDLGLVRRGGSERQRSLAALVGWSLRLLSEPERDALFAVAVFPGRFSPEMARAVLAHVPGASPHAAADLTRHSLLDLDGGEYRMLVTVKSVASRELAARPELRRQAMAGVFGWASDQAGLIFGDEPAPLPDEFRAIEIATDWGMTEAAPGRGLVFRCLVHWALASSITPTTRALAERVLRAPVVPDEDEIRLNAGALRIVAGSGIVHAEGGNAHRARELVAAARQLGDPEVLATATSQAAMTLDRAGLHDEAEALHLETLRLRADDRRRTGAALLDLGVSYHLAGRLEEAEQHYRQALECASGRTDRTACLVNIGEIMLDRGEYDDATAQLRVAVQAARGQAASSAWGLALLVEAEARRGARADARALAEVARRRLEPLQRIDPSMAHALERMNRALADE